MSILLGNARRSSGQPVHTPAPVHIGHRSPGTGDNLSGQNPARRPLGSGMSVQVSALNTTEIDWTKYEIEPRWIGSESADCVAALQPGSYHNHGAPDRDRYLKGAAGRGESATRISRQGATSEIYRPNCCPVTTSAEGRRLQPGLWVVCDGTRRRQRFDRTFLNPRKVDICTPTSIAPSATTKRRCCKDSPPTTNGADQKRRLLARSETQHLSGLPQPSPDTSNPSYNEDLPSSTAATGCGISTTALIKIS